MSRRVFAVVNGVLLMTLAVSSVYGQTGQRKSLTQRMAEMRRSWTTSEEERAPAQQFPTPHTDGGGSLIPNWLSSGNSQNEDAGGQQQPRAGSVQNSANAQQTNRNGQMPANRSGNSSNGSNRTTAGSNSGQPNANHGFALPGLGGSKLPAAGQSMPQTRAAANAGPNVRVANAPNATSQHSTTRQPNPYQDSEGSDSENMATTRKSPSVNPQALRREFAGAFSSSQSSEPVARVAQSEQSEETSDSMVSNTEEAVVELQGDMAIAEDSTMAVPAEESGEESDSSRNVAMPVQEPARMEAVEEPHSAAEAFGALESAGPSFGNSNFIRAPRTNAAPPAPSAERSKEAFGQALQVASSGDPNVLAINQAPVITTDIRGPKQILVGREAVYRVRLQNQSGARADGLVATILVPASAEVVDASVTQGSVRPNRESGMPTKCEWQLASLDARGSEVLDLRIIPRENKPLELGVTWTAAPVGSRAVVEVQEPKLKIEIGGPTEVMFDEPQVYKLTLSNPGTGPASGVKIDLVPPGGTQETATSHTFGDLKAGESRSIEIELTAREAGKLTMKALASAEGGLTSDASKEIFCRKPELEVDWRGPATKYAGTPATYFFRVRNPGTAAAEDVIVTVTLPKGAEFTSASEGQQFDAATGIVKWRVGTLNPGDDNYMELKCLVNAPGANQFKVTAANGTGNLSDSKVAETNVEAIADLKLAVSDPNGPVAVGTDAVYEIYVQNRGSNTACNVSVVGLFSEGLEPEQAQGGMYTVIDGRVTFRAIDEIPAGGDVKLKIRARATRAGTHVFRAEVVCSDLEIKLAAEETTRFYADEVMSESEQAAEQSTSSPAFENATTAGPRY